MKNKRELPIGSTDKITDFFNSVRYPLLAQGPQSSIFLVKKS